ncbi:hypothetical protein PhCBS80983_g04588 [Powellomyces hirtus]|uniref:Uncharacterized protein n=1 Tax=Powellomyces hirtus TaxID=109895 RepID=A0A507DYV5_9FUNG|nr:GPR1/FUN34/yaaH family-domain-containing protein [Powellomyces hirtus]TPX56377.1 hypothetical protein PhCBS80983_g04588 [Powellomyces hirtus]
MPYDQTAVPPATLQHSNQPHQIMSTNTLDHTGQPAYDLPGKATAPRIFLKPIAPPSALGLAAYASSTFVTATWLAAWYGNETTPYVLWPFILTFGGFGQFAAGMWAFNARDTLGSVFHTMWGSFWIAISLFLAVTSTGNNIPVDRYAYNDAWAIWMVPLAAITFILTAAAVFRDLVWAATLFTLASGSLLGVLGWFIHEPAVIKLTGYFWLVSSILAAYRVALYVMHEAAPDRDLLPRFENSRHRTHIAKGYHLGYNEPGVVAAY